MKIGLMGGTFDPVHYGHLLLAERFREQLKLDKVIFIPTGKSYHKAYNKISHPNVRYKMLELAIKDNKHFLISDIELVRKGNSYTCDTIRELKKIYKDDDLYFMIGTDVIFSIEQWKESDWVFKNIKFLLAIRENNSLEDIKKQLHHLQTKRGLNISLSYFDLVNISSSKIRENINFNKSIKYLLPVEVENFISKNNLYKEQK